ncbi:RHS repeat domain-containing protein [Rhodoligotrophos defluvii]|uniref:RHS repeat domain-containing protein n=1 Tax=Rhodoligotrophos defluvii TaxID=2561934 RepID=UPI0010C99FF8|nr:RHS repeat-associated core domain-containing protein [Rhodoligotrophos defluvii]
MTTSGTTTQTSYLLRDHLGSVDVITDEAGAVLERMSFDAWGKRREVTWQAMADATAYVPLVTTRGFTGHEQLDPVGLVHMNGRVYDPELGRFLSADPFLQDVSNLQAWNRYSYVLNNPLSMTDPTGFFFGKIFKALGNFLKGAFKAISSIVKAVIKAVGNTPLLRAAIQIVACANPAAVLTCAPVAGALTLAAGGSITDALQAMAFSIASMGGAGLAQGLAGAVQGLTEMGSALLQSAGNGVVSGALSVAQGGSFLSGFAAGSIGTFSNLGGGVLTGNNEFMSNVISVAGGGIAAEVTGGKFVNGAATAAFAIAGRAMFDGAGSIGSINDAEVQPIGGVQGVDVALGYTDTPVGLGTNHALVIGTDGITGEQYATRAGPVFPGGRGPFIGAVAGPYDETFRDPPSSVHTLQEIGFLNMPFSEFKLRANIFARTTNRNMISYQGFRFNSNSYAFTFIESLGFSRPNPIVNAPGWQDGKASRSMYAY